MKTATTASGYTIIKAEKYEKRTIMHFYKSQQYNASYIGQDHCYIVKSADSIIASAIISAGQENDNHWLLHALVTEKGHRNKRIASDILQVIFSEKNSDLQLSYPNIICFADKSLENFYLANKFNHYSSTEDIAQLPDEFRQRLLSYQEKKQNLQCFIYQAKRYKKL